MQGERERQREGERQRERQRQRQRQRDRGKEIEREKGGEEREREKERGGERERENIFIMHNSYIISDMNIINPQVSLGLTSATTRHGLERVQTSAGICKLIARAFIC